MKTIHVEAEKRDGKTLRKLRADLHVSPFDVARETRLTSVQIRELERGDWGAWNNMTHEEALNAYLDAMARIEARLSAPPSTQARPASTRAGTAFLMMSAGLVAFDTRTTPTLPKPKRF